MIVAVGRSIMKLINTENGIVQMERPTGVGLGNFDGLHIGHMALVNTLINESRLNGLESVIYTFTRHPENIMRKKLCTPLITTFEKKEELLSQTPLDCLYFDRFTEEFSRLDPRSFVKEILVDRLKVKLVVAGFNYRFGYKGQGDTDYLKELGKEFGFRVVVIPPIKAENTVVSSTSIRHYLEMGYMEKVFKMLGRHFSISGKVVSGKQIGRTIGFPTANILPESYLVLPLKGVYITKTLLDGKFYPSMTNIGYNPTFEALLRPTVETYLLDFDEDIYNRKIEVFFLERLRDETKFSSKEELIDQMNKDRLKVREFYGLAK
jgi:riboflavin kinase/FMN adenylyltransferase